MKVGMFYGTNVRTGRRGIRRRVLIDTGIYYSYGFHESLQSGHFYGIVELGISNKVVDYNGQKSRRCIEDDRF